MKCEYTNKKLPVYDLISINLLFLVIFLLFFCVDPTLMKAI